jgi:hypothetical protein
MRQAVFLPSMNRFAAFIRNICYETHVLLEMEIMLKRMKMLLVFLSLLPSSALADGICQASGRCEGKSSNIEYMECLARLAEEQDKELNRLYAKVQEMLTGYDAID